MSSSLQEIFNNYVAYLKAEKNASPYTIRNYSTDLRDFFDFLANEKINALTDISRPVLRTYLSNLVDRRFVKGSIARKQSAVRSFFRYLLRENIITGSPKFCRRNK